MSEGIRLGVAGWVRNRGDGSVEAHVQGDEQAVEAMLRWLQDGPPGARVTRCAVHQTDLEPGLSSFEIRA
jgi:acylphosphatase